MKELHERGYPLCLAPRREHVVRKVVVAVFSPVVWAEEDLNATPRGLYGVCMRRSTHNRSTMSTNNAQDMAVKLEVQYG